MYSFVIDDPTQELMPTYRDTEVVKSASGDKCGGSSPGFDSRAVILTHAALIFSLWCLSDRPD